MSSDTAVLEMFNLDRMIEFAIGHMTTMVKAIACSLVHIWLKLVPVI
mgnify:CR=1 FL=1